MSCLRKLLALAIVTFLLGAADDEVGFTSIFNGKNLDGWQPMNGCKFSAVDGVLKGDGGNGWLRSEKEYGDFVLRLEVRWLKPKQDSGVFIRAGKEGANWPDRKYEVQAENTERIVHVFGAKCERDPQKALNTTAQVSICHFQEVLIQGGHLMA